MPEFCIVEDGDAAAYVSIPRGGPIYVPNIMGPLTRVPDFEASVFHELQGLKGELSSDPLELCDTDISVDELKIITEEELVNKAFEEAFMDGEVTGNCSQISEELSNIGFRRKVDNRLSDEHACLESSGRGPNSLVSYESSNGSPLRTSDGGELSESIKEKSKRKRRVNRNNYTLEESYIAKVEQLARIKQKQEEDKAAARLHSFNGSCRISEGGTISPEKIERMTSLKSISSSTKFELEAEGMELLHVQVRASITRENALVRHPEVVLCVEVYHNKRTWVKNTKLKRKWFHLNGAIKQAKRQIPYFSEVYLNIFIIDKYTNFGRGFFGEGVFPLK